MDSLEISKEFVDMLAKSSRGGYLMMCAVLDAAGGEVRINPGDFARRMLGEAPVIEVDGTDGSVIMRVRFTG